MATILEQDLCNRERLSTRDFDRNFLVSAGAGAGKTYLTVERAFNLLCDPKMGIRPQDIVMITFTRKAATEMKTRMNRWVRDAQKEEDDPQKRELLDGLLNSLPEMQISTIHSFCQRILSDEPLASGVGFAPQFESEDGGPDSRIRQFFDAAWNTGKCPRSLDMQISAEMAYGAFKTLNSRSKVTPQFINVETADGKAFADETYDTCKRLLTQFAAAVGTVDPSMFHWTIENALRKGSSADSGTLFQAVLKIAGSGKTVREWMGKTSRKTAESACRDLGSFLSNSNADDALNAIASIFDAMKGAKKVDRHAFVTERLPMLPEPYRISAEAAGLLPDDEALDKLAGDIKLLMHGIITGEACSLREAYADWRAKNHIVSLDDMLSLTAELVRNNPQARQKLHERYKVFFVDEYQDTDPIQTDIIFGIAADRYDPDWHKSVPHPGSLFLVGDAKQGIYRFRGADISMWQEAEDVMRATGGEVVQLYQNFRSTAGICSAVTDVFGEGGALHMQKDSYQAEDSEMAAHRGHGPEAVFQHTITCASADEGHEIAAAQIAQMIQDRVKSGQNRYEDFLLLSFYREKHSDYSDEFRRRGIPLKFDGSLPIDAYQPIQKLNLRVQAVCHPFDEVLSFRVLCECCDVLLEEWDLFRMNVGRLPEESNLTRYRSSRDLMAHVDELTERLPDTGMNRHILRALAMLNRDRLLSQERTPCAFLEELMERSEGLFTEPYDAEETQNQYAALLQVIDSIRAQNPMQFTDMAEMLKTFAESDMDRMPSIRADSNFVRLMNLHKAKGLQGKVVFYLPGKPSTMGQDSHVERRGTEALGWFQISNPGSFLSTKYDPPEWEERKKEEEQYHKAEITRLKYVALTRAEDEAHIFTLSIEQEGKKPQAQKAWSGFERIGSEAVAVKVESPKEEEPAELSKAEWRIRQAQRDLAAGIASVNRKAVKRALPSDLDTKNLKQERRAADTVKETATERTVQDKPGGPVWGTAVHRALELIVTQRVFTEEGIAAAAQQAVSEQFQSELLSERDRRALRMPIDAVTLEQIQTYLINAVCESLHFMTDETSPLRRMIAEAVACYPEMSFTISAHKSDGDLFKKLSALVGSTDESRIDLTGKIDLALRFSDGTWQIIDYKTDRMLPSDGGSQQVFQDRLSRTYGAQLETYKAVLEYLTGQSVTKARLFAL